MRKNLSNSCNLKSRIYSLSDTWNAFLVLYEHRNFSTAAKTLGLTQSALSRIIQKLEKQIAITLFNRRLRPIRPTPEAVALYEEILRNTAQIEVLLKTLQSENFIRPVLRFGCTESTRRLIAPQIAKFFAKRLSKFVQFTGSSDWLIDRLIKREADIVLICDPFDEIKGLSRRYIYEEPSVLLLPKVLVDLKKDWKLRELQHCGLPMISISGNTGGGRLNERVFTEHRLHFASIFEVDSDEVLVEMVKSGLGWALTRPSTLLSGRDFGDKVFLQKIEDSDASLKFYVLNRLNEFEQESEEIAHICKQTLKKH